ncbi:MAG: transketolase family protein, partial [Bacteroidales bacterium]|nr:transketolase family protein [Bacteroidales bacterium]
VASARKTGAVVTAEEHSLINGLGDSVAHVLAANCPTPMSFVAMEDRFGESGTPLQLMEHFGLKSGNIVKAVQKVLKMK